MWYMHGNVRGGLERMIKRRMSPLEKLGVLLFFCFMQYLRAMVLLLNAFKSSPGC